MKHVRSAFLGMGVLFVFSTPSSAELIYGANEIIVADPSLIFTSVHVGEADSDISGPEVYVTYTTVSEPNTSALIQYSNDGQGWTAQTISSTTTARYNSVVVGDVRSDLSGNEVFLGQNGKILSYSKSTGSWDPNQLVSSSLDYKKLKIGEFDPPGETPELYSLSRPVGSDGGVDQFTYDSGWSKVDVETKAADTGEAIWDFAIGDIFPNSHPGNEIVLVVENNQSFVRASTDLGWDPLFPYVPGRLWAVAIGDVWDGSPGDEWHDRDETAFFDLQFGLQAVDLYLVNENGAFEGGDFEHAGEGWNEPMDMLTADFDNDGVEEVVVAVRQIDDDSPGRNPSGESFEIPGELKVHTATDGSLHSWEVTYVLENIDVYDVTAADMNGDGFKDIVYAAAGQFGVIYVSPNPCTNPPIGDFTNDCLVNMFDLAIFSNNWLADTRDF